MSRATRAPAAWRWAPFLSCLTFGALTPGLALADAERLEADLQALFADQGQLEIGDVSDALLRDRVTAEALRFTGDDGERLSIARYVVSGDYDAPSEVVLEGIRLEEAPELPLLEIERIVLGEPPQAVLPLNDSEAMRELRLASLTVDDIALELVPDPSKHRGEFPFGEAQLTIEQVSGESLSREAIGRLAVTGLSSTAQGGEVGAGTLSLGGLRIEELTGLDDEGEENLALLEVNDLAVEAERLVGSLTRLHLTGDIVTGESEFGLDELRLDLARMIELAPAEERTRLRMIAKTLTGGTNELHLNAAMVGGWEEHDGRAEVSGDGHIDLVDAMRLAFDMRLPLALPEGVPAAELFADEGALGKATLLGGELGLHLFEHGLFGRLATLGAAMAGVSEAQYIEQARSQAQGFGMMFGAEVQAFLLGLVDMMDGEASELDLFVTLPAESSFATYADDPMGLSEKLDLRVETR